VQSHLPKDKGLANLYYAEKLSAGLVSAPKR